jgi:hypothetical protein
MEVKQAAKERAEAAGLSIKEMHESADAKPQYTFMGYDARSRARLPHGYGDEFPAFLTHVTDAARVHCRRDTLQSSQHVLGDLGPG